MKQIFTFLVVMLSWTGIQAQKQVIRDSNAEPREVGSFHAIEVSNAFDVYLTQSDEYALAVSASGVEYRDRIRTSVENGTLRIWYDNNNRFRTGNKQLKAYVSFKTLDRLAASGACDLKISGVLKADDLDLKLSGASDLKGAVNIRSMVVDVSGASDVDVTGEVADLKVRASGASQVKGFDLHTETCDAEASGASDIRVTVNKELKASASGASGINYRGAGVIKSKTSGASHISSKD